MNMSKVSLARAVLALALLAGAASVVHADGAPLAHRVVRVGLPAASQGTSGRLILFAMPASAAKDGKAEEVDTNPFQPTAVSVAARDVGWIGGGQTVDLDTDGEAFPAGFSSLPSGDYLIQAVLDVGHDYNYSGRHAGDLISPVTAVRLTPGGSLPTLTLDTTVPAKDPWNLPPAAPQAIRDALPEARKHAHAEVFESPALTAFAGRPLSIRAWVLTPPGYDPKASTRYPTVYLTHGFGGGFDRFTGTIASVWSAMANKQMPPMIWVLLDESGPTGTHEFADSVNNGPWGQALTTEYIPWLEARYKMDARVSGRFLNGHSSGGWATLWLQTRYPKVFGGTWSTSPDPSDFHDFTGIDLYAPHANAYKAADGTPYPLIRDKGKVIATFETFAHLERVLGAYGGQLASFEWVFSPRGADGRPQPMFNRDTGAIDANVVAYWRDHYDIAQRMRTQWPSLRPDLDGKIHLIVGTADTFYLDGSAKLLKDTLDGLHAKSDFRFLPGKTHFDLYTEGDDRQALLKKIAWEMYGVARPGQGKPGG
ncbi:MAG: alpha/beta hydrolase-fold protein [Luteibacter sp.]|uniref:alpha/beta hydrolase n=1 Tax=unclassified Luteibacter TaxID=2620188 RepID=UPI0005B8FF23|nr:MULTISPECIES: alpha/beta hydrolase-fold protein [unclassified Luteibacter]MDQ7997814.1 alpha/beta hydrolase-fold protein [Luteibacter sp.]